MLFRVPSLKKISCTWNYFLELFLQFNLDVCHISATLTIKSVHERIFVICAGRRLFKTCSTVRASYYCSLLKSASPPLSSFAEYYDSVARYIFQQHHFTFFHLVAVSFLSVLRARTHYSSLYSPTLRSSYRIAGIHAHYSWHYFLNKSRTQPA